MSNKMGDYARAESALPPGCGSTSSRTRIRLCRWQLVCPVLPDRPWVPCTLERATSPTPSRSFASSTRVLTTMYNRGGLMRSGMHPRGVGRQDLAAGPRGGSAPAMPRAWKPPGPPSHVGRADYGRAEPLLRQAVEIRRKAQGASHPDYAAALNALAELGREVKGDLPPAASRSFARRGRSSGRGRASRTPTTPRPWSDWPGWTRRGATTPAPSRSSARRRRS